MSLLTLTQDACDRIGLPRPSAVVGSSDSQVRMLLALANQTGRALVKRHDWQRATFERTLTATATEEQSNALPTDFERMVPKTFWNRTTDRMVVGPLSPQRWQQIKSGLVTSVYDCFRIRGNGLLMTPTPAAGDSLAFEYVSKYWCMSASDTQEDPDQSAWAQDTDVSIWDDEVLTLGVHWRFLQARGLDYGEAFRAYEVEVTRLISHDGVIHDLEMVTGATNGVSAPTVLEGNWDLD